MRALVLVLVVAAFSPAHAEPEPARYFASAQLGLGAAELTNDLELATSWSISAGARILPRLAIVSRLRHTSPFRGGLWEDLLVAWASEGLGFGELREDPDERRTHQTELGVGLRYEARWLWAEALWNGQLRYQVNGRGDFDNRALWTVDATIGAWFTEAADARFGMFLTAAVEARSGAFSRALLGFEVLLGM